MLVLLLPFLTFITFLVLQLTDVIDWSWWLVTAPLWIIAISFVLGVLFFKFLLKTVYNELFRN